MSRAKDKCRVCNGTGFASCMPMTGRVCSECNGSCERQPLHLAVDPASPGGDMEVSVGYVRDPVTGQLTVVDVSHVRPPRGGR